MLLKNTSIFCLMILLIVAVMPGSAFMGFNDEDGEDVVEGSVSNEKLPVSVNLLDESRKAACHGQPLVVMFGSSTCPYCELVRSLYLFPLMEDQRFPGIIIRELKIDSDQMVTDFSGLQVSMSKLAARYKVSLVPQVMVFGAGGKPVGKPLIGISNEDYYAYYLDQAIIAGVSNGAPNSLPAEYVCD